MKNHMPHIVESGDGSLVVKGSAEQIQEGEPIEAMTRDGEEITVIPGNFIQKFDDGTVAHHIVSPIQKPEIREHPSQTDAFIIVGPATQIQEGKRIEAVTPDGEEITVIPGNFIKKFDDGTVAHHIIVPPIQKPEIREHPSQTGAFIIVGPATQIQEGKRIEAVTPDGEEITVIPGNFIKKFDDGTVAHHIIVPPIQKPEIREHPSQTGAFIIIGPATQIQEGEPIEAVTPEGETITVFPEERIERSEDDKVVHMVRSLDHRALFMDRLKEVAKAYARTHNAPVFYYNGEINQLGLKKLINVVDKENQNNNRDLEQRVALLILFTPGGDPHVAYKCAKLLWERYHKFRILVPGICKSAGTLLAIGADEIHVSDFGELGPIDMQVLERDEGRLGSSATIRASLNAIKENSYDTFRFYMDKLNEHYGTIKLATRLNIANDMAGRIDKTITERIDPIELGKMHRFLQTCFQYGIRLAESSGNVDADGVKKLVYDYPEHGFVIDKRESLKIFKKQIHLGPDLVAILGTIKPRIDELNSESYYGKLCIELIAEPSLNS